MDTSLLSLPMRLKRALPSDEDAPSIRELVDATSKRKIAQPLTRRMKAIRAIQENWPDGWDGSTIPPERLIIRDIAPRIEVDGKKALAGEDDVALLPPGQWAKRFVDALKELSDLTKNNRMSAMNRLTFAVQMRTVFGTGDDQWEWTRERFALEVLCKDIMELCAKIRKESKA
ncbi:uncharacterized protein N0V89_001517 [Didymosphaeria variabile]|uniref:Uncharacterized protein n=1 Tax=Didymosphaeria variabile TaxID=1932322 RepID=A0A9W9CFZ6_9PLEO|nr:uncharacterized protein N0V89_001517 [Didymosphaeria variabile]KAJ4360948.1 hypothetical protein N0V89_001517 [Didymosphaeria variabile]